MIFRLFCALCLSTAFAPDEFWQGPEVAHRLIFGYDYIKLSLLCRICAVDAASVSIFRYGHLTWEWGAGLRSYVHPLLYGSFYYFLKLLGLDGRYAIFKGPQLLHSVLAAWTDVSVYRLTLVYFRNERLSKYVSFYYVDVACFGVDGCIILQDCASVPNAELVQCILPLKDIF